MERQRVGRAVLKAIWYFLGFYFCNASPVHLKAQTCWHKGWVAAGSDLLWGGGPCSHSPGTQVEQKDKAELLVKLLCVLPPVSHILSPSQILLTSKGTPRRAPLCRGTAKQQHSVTWCSFCSTSSSSRSAHKWQVATKMIFYSVRLCGTHPGWLHGPNSVTAEWPETQRGQLRHSLVRGVPSLDCTRRLRVPTLSIPTLLSSAQECSQGGAKTSFPTSQSFILIAGRAGEFQVIKVIWPY